jgi:nuclear GTP-binding protein
VNNNKIINPNRTTPKGKTHLRDQSTIKRIAMYKEKPIRNRDGEFISGAYMSRIADERVKRVAPNRAWFGNTRVVGQKELEHFREEMSNKINDPYTVIMRSKKLPMGLLNDPFKVNKCNIYIYSKFVFR